MKSKKKNLFGSLARSGLVGVAIALVVIGGIALGVALAKSAPAGEDERPGIEFTDVRQSRKFIGFNRTISLSAEQEAIKREALTELRAPCCAKFTLYTCCCECNLAKSAWGLSHLLITEYDYGAEEVRVEVSEWLDFINSRGFSGDACFTGGCGRPFKHNGCGGMEEARIVW